MASQRAIGESDIRSGAATPVPVSSDLLYVGNTGNNSITVYHHDAEGDTAPLKVIAGSKTRITSPRQLSEDAAGNLYVLNDGPVLSVLVFAHGANGNVAPIRDLSGPLTEFASGGPPNFLQAMTVDQSTGKLFVVTAGDGGLGVGTYLLRFPPNATGNEAPYARSGQVYGELVQQISNDSTGKNIIASYTDDEECNCIGAGVITMAKQFYNNAPDVLYQMRLISPEGAYYGIGGLVDDPTTKTYLAVTSIFPDNPSIQRFAENDTTFKPISTIENVDCGGELALGYLRNIYITHSKNSPYFGWIPNCPSDAVYVYEHDASGNVAPLRILTGPKTLLDSPVGIYEGA